jgi:phosphoglucomutase
MSISPLAGKPADPAHLADLPKLVTAYYQEVPDPAIPAQRVAFGTSGHRGSSLSVSFNQAHIHAITQAICIYRKSQGIDGPLFLGLDTHALSIPALASALEVLAANGVEVMLATNDEFSPTPVISWAILHHNQGRVLAPNRGLADGIVITPSHNPPTDGGFKYNPPHGGPADSDITKQIETQANAFLAKNLDGVQRMAYARALKAGTTKRFDYLGGYIADLANVLDIDAIRGSSVRLGVDPLGGAGVHYWQAIADRYRLNLSVVSDLVDATFRFMSVDWDGQIRMDPSSPYAMQRLIGLKDKFDVAVACDTDHDRHGIVTTSAGLLPPNHYLATCIQYLFRNRPGWRAETGVGKTLVSSAMIDRVCARLGRKMVEVPVGFKWFVAGLTDGSFGFVGEESAGATMLRRDGTVWTTDKDGIVIALLAAEMTAREKKDPGQLYADLTKDLGASSYERIDAPATPAQKAILAKLSAEQIKQTSLAGEPITAKLTNAPGNHAAIGGLKVTTANGWFAARPSGTENVYKIYAESFLGDAHLKRIQTEAQAIVSSVIGS